MITSRPLTFKDIDVLTDLVKLRPETFNGFTDEQLQEDIIDNVPKWVSHPLNYSVGLFLNSELVGAMIALESEYSPSWTWAYWISKPGFGINLFVAHNGFEAFKHADQMLFDEMETRRKLNRFFVSYRHNYTQDGLKNAGMSPRLFDIMKRHNFRISRYHFITDCMVEANTIPRYEYQKNILGNRVWPIDVEIRMGVLIQ